MGMFDTILASCPICGEENEFQSKGGDCFLENYNLEDCPDDVLSDANRHRDYNKCECGALLVIDIEKRKVITEGAEDKQLNSGE